MRDTFSDDLQPYSYFLGLDEFAPPLTCPFTSFESMVLQLCSPILISFHVSPIIT